MSFRAILSSRSFINASRSAGILRSLTTRTRLGAGIAARNAYRSPQVQMRGFQSTAFRAYAGPKEESVDKELSDKLAEELKLEGSMDEGMEIPQSIQEYLQNSPFKVKDVPGSDEVVLTRNYGSETITVSFSISAANFDNDIEDDYNWDGDDDGPSDGQGGLLDEDPDLPTIDSKSGRVMSKPRKSGSPFEWLMGVKTSGYSSGGSQIVAKKNKKNKRQEPDLEEDEFPEAEEYDEELEGADDENWGDEQGGSRYAPINTKITISKGDNAGSLTVTATATESIFVIDSVSYDANPPATQETAQSEFESRSRYGGPPWQQLDEDLQLLMERYLEERGINTALAIFIPDYAELKEQKEYISWLKNLKSFVDQ